MEFTFNQPEMNDTTPIPLDVNQQEIEALRQWLTIAREQEKSAQDRIKALEAAAETLQQRDCLLEATATIASILLTVGDLDDAVHQALQIIGETLETDRVNIIENIGPPDGSQFLHWHVLYEWDAPGTVPQFSDPQAAQGSYEQIPEIFEQLRQGNIMSYRIEDAPDPFRQSQIAIGVKATYLIPIQVEGQWWGVVGLDDCREVKHRSAAELSVLNILANCVGNSIQRQRSQQAMLQAEQVRSQELERYNTKLQQTLERLSESEQRYRQLMELASEGIFRLEYEEPISVDLPLEEQVEQIYQQFRYAEHNLAFARMYGYDQADALVGASLAHMIGAPENATQMEQFVRDGHQMRNQETVEVDRFGRKRHFLNNGFSIIRDGYAIGGWGTQIDITELRETQEALLQVEQARAAELAKANEALARAAERLVEQPDLSAFLHHITLEAIAQLDADAAMLSIVDEQRQVLRAVAHVDQDSIPVSSLAVEMSIDEAEFVSVLLETRKPRYFDLKQEAHLFCPGAIAYHQERHHQAAIAVPLFIGGKFLGHLGLAFTHTNPIRDQESELLYALAQQAALAIQLTRLAEEAKQTAIAREQEKAAQQQASELSKANALLRNSLSHLSTEPDLKDVLGRLLVEVTRYAGASVGHIFTYNADRHTLTMTLRVRDEQVFWTAADDEPAIFRSPISVATTPIFTRLRDQPRLATLNADQFEGRLWTGVLDWFQAKGYQGTSSCVLMVGDRPFGFLAMAFPQPVTLRLVDEELILALAQQIALVMQLTTLAEAAQETALLEERNRFARDIHDTIAQALTGIIMQLEAAKGVFATQPDIAHEHLTRASALAREGLAEARRSVRALRPEALELQNLPTALHQLLQRMTAGTELNAAIQVVGNPFLLAPTIELNLLRIGQEALTNVLRHAQAKTVCLTLEFALDAVRLDVIDDGQGFNPQQLTINHGFGLIGMQERSQQLGGTFSLISHPGAGTKISVTIPTSGA